MSDKQSDPTVAGSMLTALIGLVCLSIGVSIAFGGEWALIVVGSIFIVYSLLLGFRSRTQTLMFADNKTTNH